MNPVTLGRLVDAAIYGFIGATSTWTGWRMLHPPKTDNQEVKPKSKAGTYLMIAGPFLLILCLQKLWQAFA